MLRDTPSPSPTSFCCLGAFPRAHSPQVSPRWAALYLPTQKHKVTAGASLYTDVTTGRYLQVDAGSDGQYSRPLAVAVEQACSPLCCKPIGRCLARSADCLVQRLSTLLFQESAPQTLALTGVLGLAAFLYGIYQLRQAGMSDKVYKMNCECIRKAVTWAPTKHTSEAAFYRLVLRTFPALVKPQWHS